MKIPVMGILNFWAKAYYECLNMSNISNSCWDIYMLFKADWLPFPSPKPYCLSKRFGWHTHTFYTETGTSSRLSVAFTHQPRCIFTVAGFGLKVVVFISEYPASLSRCFQVTENMMFGDRLSITLCKKKVKGGQDRGKVLPYFISRAVSWKIKVNCYQFVTAQCSLVYHIL